MFFLEHSNGKWLGENQSAAKKGDIVFFDWPGKGMYDHADVITKVKNGKAYVTAHYRTTRQAAQRVPDGLRQGNRLLGHPRQAKLVLRGRCV
uniref:amidase domain-containing protein n=1 Tax=Streptomyces hawaiiensis TaxID=67305 RepID=UPI003CD071AA